MPQKTKQKKAEARARLATKQQKNEGKQAPWWQKRWFYVGAAIAAVLLLVGVAAGSSRNRYENGLIRHIAEIRDVARVVQLNGQVEPVRDARVGFEAGGRVAEVFVAEGQFVLAGEEIMRLSTTTLEAERQQAVATLAAKQANLAQVRRGSRTEETAVLFTSLENAEKNLAEVRIQQDVLVENAYQTLLTDDLEAFPSDFDTNATPPTVTGFYDGGVEGVFRLVTFYDSASGSRYSFRILGLGTGEQELTFDAPAPLGDSGLFVQFTEGDTYRNTVWEIPVPNKQGASYAVNLAAYESAKKARTVAVAAAEAAVATARAEFDLDGAGASSEDVRVAQAEVDQAVAQLAAIDARIDERIVRAPFDGLVANLDAEVGELIAPNTVVATILAPDRYQVVMNVPEIDIGSIAIGNHVNVALDAYPGEFFDAVVISIDPAESIIDGVTVYEATLLFDVTDPRVRSGMTADARVTVDERLQVIAIPGTAIRQDEDGKEFVTVESAGERRDKEVEIGLRGTDGWVEVVAGLSVGEVVVESLDV